jgi:hypothetical protein
MAALNTTTGGGLAKYVGATVETLSGSMTRGAPVPRTGFSPSSVRIKNTPENRAAIDQFAALASTGRVANERLSYEIELECVGLNRAITIGSVDKPNVRANMGDVAEGVFAAAVGARFLYKNQTITYSQVSSVLRQLSASGRTRVPGKNGFRVEMVRPSPNLGIALQDDVRIFVSLAETNMNFLLNPGNTASLRPYINAALAYANSITVRQWADLVYTNRRYDKIEIISDGLSGQTTTKVDVRVKITDDEGNLRPVNINVSLKAGDVKQFGQLGGTEFSDLVQFFNNLFGIGNILNQHSNRYEQMTKVNHQYDEALRFLYGEVQRTLTARLASAATSANLMNIVGNGINYYATLNEENVQLVQLNNSEAKIYQFQGVGERLQNYAYESRLSYSGEKRLPQIDINNSDGKLLLRIRVKGENKRDRNGRSYTYFRNYVEKGEFLGDLIATYA